MSPSSAQQIGDVDGDGVFDGDRPGLADDETDPNSPDTDDDGLTDGDEGRGDIDGDGTINALDPSTDDRDADGLSGGIVDLSGRRIVATNGEVVNSPILW